MFSAADSAIRPAHGAGLTQNCHAVTEIIPRSEATDGRTVAIDQVSSAFSARFQID
jgi:hypothetical protein